MNISSIIYGYHVSSASISLNDMLNQHLTKEDSINAIQFYLGNNTSYIRRKVTDSEVRNIDKLRQNYEFRLFTHSPYVINLASPDDTKLTKSINSLNTELKEAEKIQAQVVVHMGSMGGIDKLVESVSQLDIPASYEYPLLLECSSGSKKKINGYSSKIGGTMEELQYVFDRIPNNVGLCIDTAHVYAVPEYDISKKEDMQKLFEDIENCIGIHKLQLIHLNDSKAEHGSYRDLHEGLGKGNIWNNDVSSLEFIVNKCKDYNVPMIGETDDPEDYMFLKSLNLI